MQHLFNCSDAIYSPRIKHYYSTSPSIAHQPLWHTVSRVAARTLAIGTPGSPQSHHPSPSQPHYTPRPTACRSYGSACKHGLQTNKCKPTQPTLIQREYSRPRRTEMVTAAAVLDAWVHSSPSQLIRADSRSIRADSRSIRADSPVSRLEIRVFRGCFAGGCFATVSWCFTYIAECSSRVSRLIHV